MQIFSIDPGNEQSAWLIYDTDRKRPRRFGKIENAQLMPLLDEAARAGMPVAIEMIASYGMAVGKEVFDTCLWIGRFLERRGAEHCRLVYRREVKLHLCGSCQAKDPNVRRALIDLFGPTKERAIGLKASPGPLYGISSDVWSALAVAVTVSAKQEAA